MIKWSDEYSVKISSIDHQHEMFIGLINQLETLTKGSDYLEGLPRLLNEIVEYANLHFKTEEKLLTDANYIRLEEHKKIHESIKGDIYKECKQIIEKEPTTMDVIWLYNYMTKWIKNHILEEDMRYVDALKEFHDL